MKQYSVVQNMLVALVLYIAFVSCCNQAALAANDAANRYSRSADGVITDSQTNLQWLLGPNQNVNYHQAEQWVAAQTMAGGGWRMPTRVELKTLYDSSFKDNNISPIFGVTYANKVWAEARDSSAAWRFSFTFGAESLKRLDYSDNSTMVIAVRPSR